jgi:hypothetical protein
MRGCAPHSKEVVLPGRPVDKAGHVGSPSGASRRAPLGLSFQVWPAIPGVVGCLLRLLAPLGATPLRGVAGLGIPCLGLLLGRSLCPTRRAEPSPDTIVVNGPTGRGA